MATLQGKTALVTGASRGIGRATASALANAGAHVLVHYARSAQDAESLVAGIRSRGGRADPTRADMGTPDGATLLAKEVRSFVGITKSAAFKDHTVEDFDNLSATNVRSPFFLVQQLLPILGEGSNIIVIFLPWLVRWLANPVWTILRSSPMPRPKEQSRLLSRTGRPCSDPRAFA